jgi:phosphatidylinositol glycan class T
MPYNVIILTSTVMAMGFGSIFNIVVRRFVAVDELSNAPFGLLVAAVVQRAQGRFRRLVARFGGGREKTE